MKKMTSLIFAVMAYISVMQAKVIDFTTTATAIGDWTVINAAQNAAETEEAYGKFVYDIKQSVLSETYITAEPNVVFQVINNAGDKAKAFIIYPGKCYQFGGKNGILLIAGTYPGTRIVLTVASRSSSISADFKDPAGFYPKNAVAVSEDLTIPAKNNDKAGTDGYDEDGYFWKEIEYTSFGGDVEIKEFASGYRIKKIEYAYSITTSAIPEDGGSVNSAYQLDNTCILTAIPNNGYHFVQWNDSITENPRTIVLTQDTTFTAEFANDKGGWCGKDFALEWTYDAESKTLTISGNGSFDAHMECGLQAKQRMTNLVIGEGVTAIGANAFSGCTNLATLQLPASLKTIGERAFYNCLDLTSIYNYRPNPCLIETNTFEKVNTFDCTLYVLAESVDKYNSEASGWKIFYEIKPIGATQIDTDDEVTAEPTDNTVTMTWPTDNNAATYTIQITKDGVVFCTLIFNAAGQLTGIAFAPNRNGQAQAPAAAMTSNGMQFIVTGLNSSTNYAFSIVAKDNTDNIIASYSGSFKTTGSATAIDQITNDQSPMTNKIIKDGQLFILRDDKVYTVTGQEVR